MQTTLRTSRIRSGLYLSYDGRWQIARVSHFARGGKRWFVYHLTDGNWREVTHFKSLAAARAFIVQTINEAWF